MAWPKGFEGLLPVKDVAAWDKLKSEHARARNALSKRPTEENRKKVLDVVASSHRLLRKWDLDPMASAAVNKKRKRAQDMVSAAMDKNKRLRALGP